MGHRMGRIYQHMRVKWYRQMWSAPVHGKPRMVTPALVVGPGEVVFGSDVTLGWMLSPGALSGGYTYIEARSAESKIKIGDGSHLNNCVCLISEGPGIALGSRCLLGVGVHISDSDFHPLDPARRGSDPPGMARVAIGDDVFIGTNALILKGTTIGNCSVVGAGAVVSGHVPAGVIVAGNPAAIVRPITGRAG